MKVIYLQLQIKGGGGRKIQFQNSPSISSHERIVLFSSYSQKDYCSGRRQKTSYIQVIHVSLTYPRRFEYHEKPVTIFRTTIMWFKGGEKQGLVFFRKTQTALDSSSQSNPGDSVLRDTESHPRMAHRQKCLSVIHHCLWNVVRESRTIARYPNYRRFSATAPFILDVVRFDIEHSAIVNHVWMPWQLCQAESECPLLARLRPTTFSKMVQF